MKHLLPAFLLITLFSIESSAQCPANEADLANGGTFSGDCTIDVGGSITITGAIIWTSGRLTINDTGGGGDGDMFINSGGSITLQSGATLDMDDGDITVNTGGSITVEAGGELEVDNNNRDVTIAGGTINSAGTITVSDNMTISGAGTFNMTGGSLDVVNDLTVDGAGSSLNLSNDASITGVNQLNFTDGATGDFGLGTSILIQNTLTLDDATVTIAGDFETTSNGNDADITLNGSSNLNIEEGANVVIDDDIDFGDDEEASTITINGGSLSLGDDLKFNDNDGNDSDAIIVNGGELIVTNNIQIEAGSSITINGGTVTSGTVNGNVPGDESDYPDEIVINGGDVSSGGVSLPVTLVEFSGAWSATKNSILLQWSTATEINNHGFYVEKSIDGGTFTDIGFVGGNGNFQGLINYSFADRLISSDYYYRLKQEDFDGTITYSPVIFVNINDILNQKITIYPNPTFEGIKISGLSNAQFDFQLYNQSGKVIIAIENDTVENSSGILEDAIKNTEPGTYILKVSNASFQYTTKIIKR